MKRAGSGQCSSGGKVVRNQKVAWLGGLGGQPSVDKGCQAGLSNSSYVQRGTPAASRGESHQRYSQPSPRVTTGETGSIETCLCEVRGIKSKPTPIIKIVATTKIPVGVR